MPPRIRSLKPDCWQDEALGTVSRDARLLFVGLITQADDEGRLKAGIPLLRSLVFPYDTDLDLADLESWLTELAAVHLLIRYRIEGRDYIAFPNWEKHQRINRATDSQIPPPSEDSMIAHGGLIEDSPPRARALEGSKERIRIRKFALTREESPLCFLLADLVEGNGSKRPEITQRWADAERLMLERDKRDPAEAERLVRWSQEDEFWRTNVLSMPKFREKYDQLRLKAGASVAPTDNGFIARLNARGAA